MASLHTRFLFPNLYNDNHLYMDRPKSNPDLYKLPPEEYNAVLQQTFAYFAQKRVKLKDGRIGTVISVDPRPMRQNSPTSPGQDGNWLCVSIRNPKVKPGKTPMEREYAMPDDVELLDPPPADPVAPAEGQYHIIPPEETTTTTTS